MLLYSHIISPRLQYIAGFIGNEILNEPFRITIDKEEFTQSIKPKINFSNKRISTNEYFLNSHALIFEKDIKPQSVECFDLNGQKVFF